MADDDLAKLPMDKTELNAKNINRHRNGYIIPSNLRRVISLIKIQIKKGNINMETGRAVPPSARALLANMIGLLGSTNIGSDVATPAILQTLFFESFIMIFNKAYHIIA